MPVLQRLFDRILARPVIFFYDSLRESPFFLVSYLAGTYLVIRIASDDLTGRPSSIYASDSIYVLVLGILLLVVATWKRLTDLGSERICR